MEAWEALDIDDSDLPSLLPCKRRHHHRSPHKSNQIGKSSPSPPPDSPPASKLQHTQCNPQFASQTIKSQSQNTLSQLDPSATSPRLIPGPAGAVQAAMDLCNGRSFSCRSGEDCIPTQEYLRIVEGNGEEDQDFKLNSWLCAMDFLGSEVSGTLDDDTVRTPLRFVKQCKNGERVAQVVAIIKSCAPNGLGDLIVTLKDPTGTIGATIHRKVLSKEEFGRDISMGSVLILQKVAVFSPSRAANYLNITVNNVLKVIGKECEPQLRKKSRAANNILPAFGRPDCRSTLEKDSLVQKERSGKIMSLVRKNASTRGMSDNDKQEEGNHIPVDKDSAIRSSNGDQGGGSVQWDNEVLVENFSDTEKGRNTGLQKQRQAIASLPRWTDEQLDELFALDCENDGSLF